MYQAQKALFFYCVSPVHMGAGTAIGLIDNPIQRERHTDYPLFAGSGIKGAVRHHFHADGWNKDEELLNRIFGPKNSEFAGAVSFGDAQLVAFPVRCTKHAYVYATSPTALARTRRQLEHLQVTPDWKITEVEEGGCRVVPGSGLTEGTSLNLEVFQYTATDEKELAKIAGWLADQALPPGDAYAFFRDKLKTDLVLLPDEDFTYYIKNATVVEPHVRIDDKTGTADDGGLFYTENLPPESLLLAPLMASGERRGRHDGSNDHIMCAQEVMEKVLDGHNEGVGLNGLCLQLGGDATTGRGQVIVTSVEEKDNDADT